MAYGAHNPLLISCLVSLLPLHSRTLANSIYISFSLELSLLLLRALPDHLHQLTLWGELTSVVKTPIPRQVLSLSPYLSLHSGTNGVQNFLRRVLAVFDEGEPRKPSKAS